MLARLGRWQDAKTYLEKAVKQDPNLAPAYRNLGWVLSNLRTVDGNIESVQDLMGAYRQALALYEVQNQNEGQEISNVSGDRYFVIVLRAISLPRGVSVLYYCLKL